MTKGQALAATVLIHFGVSVAHGAAHTGAHVPLPLAGALFVYIVILAGPLAGLAVAIWRPRAGALIVAASMCGALVFGLINHFLVDGQDQVAHVVADWRTLFGVTAVLLAVTEGVGTAVGLWGSKSEFKVGVKTRS